MREIIDTMPHVAALIPQKLQSNRHWLHLRGWQKPWQAR
jgi:hypothetical protein